MFYSYGVLALLGAVYLTFRNRPRRVLLGIVLAFWILGGSIIHQGIFDLPLKALGGNLQIRQLIVLITAVYFVIASLIGLPRTGNPKPLAFEKYYLLFAGVFIAVCVYHVNDGMLTIRDLRGLAEGTILVLLMYLLLRRYADRGLAETIVGAIIIAGAVTAIVSMIQFLVAPDFLRIGSALPAFGGRFRSKGIFDTEYLNGFFLLVAAITVLFHVPKKGLRAVLLSLYGTGIFLTFHRMSWIAAMMTLILYVMVTGRVRSGGLIVAGLFVAGLLVVLAAAVVPPVTEALRESAFYRSRLSADTMTDRLKFFEMVWDNLDKVALWGAGSAKNSLYYHGMLGTGVVDEKWALGQRGGIHNGFLETLFFYGLPVLALYCLVLWKSAREFYKNGVTGYALYFAPFFVLAVFLCMNLTNSLPWYTAYGNLTAIVLGITAISTAHLRGRGSA